jgi:ABC-type transport system involved in multi-copper enzyme maturation permease subunit
MITLVIARLTFHEAARRKVLLAALLLGLVFLALYATGFYYMHQDVEREQDRLGMVVRREVCSFFLMAGLYVVNFLTMAMTVLTSVDTLAGEISSGTVHTLVSKPVRRWEIVMGKWLGFVGMLTLYLLLMAGGVIATVYLIAGYTPPHVLRGASLIWLNGVLLLSASMLGGAVFSTLANGVMVFGLYGIAFVGGWIEQFGSFARKQAAVNVGVASSLIFPSEALWKRAAFEMQSPLVKALGFSPFSAPSPPNAVMVGYAVVFALTALALAIHRFSSRDL